MKKLAILIIILLLPACKIMTYKAEQTRELMGTTVTVVVLHEDENTAREGIRRAFRAMQSVNDEMGPYGTTSLVSELNKNKIIAKPTSSMSFVLQKSLEYSEVSNGAFDITVQPVLDLYTKTFKENRTPTQEEIDTAMKSVGYKKVIIEENAVTIEENMSITLGAIAKGYAVDEAIEALQQTGIKRAMVNAGGDIRAIGTKEGDQKWQVALQNPRNKTELITIIELENMSVATSGDYERYFDENKTYHHIINPKTGHSATELISVTVIAPKAVDADSLATTVFVLGREKGIELVERLPNVEALIITKDREIIRSSRFRH
ncbi:MAG: FAD:protein FMN transferase [Candidatus Woesearchaeota archaeon]